MKNRELKRKIISFLIIALMLSSVFSGAVMVLASVNTTINDTSTDDEARIDTDTAHPTIIDHSPTSDNASVNASIQVTFSEAMNETSVEDAFSIHPSVVGSFDWDGNVMNFIPDILSYSTAYDISINEEASDLAGNSLESSYSWEFTTKSQDQDIDADTKSPIISDVSTVNIITNSTTITWRTDKPSDSLVKYGTETGKYTLFANDPSFVTEHNIKITGLLSSTTYYYAVNSTDSSKNQNESAEYDFNTLLEAEEIVDVSPPTLTFVSPTPTNNLIVSESEIIITITADEYLDIAILDWNGTNETMQGSGRNWYIDKRLTSGAYIYRVYGKDTADNWAVSGTRTVTVVPPAPVVQAPLINDLFNNITNDNSISITINKSQSIFFSATADQNIDTWHWYKDGIDQLNNCDSYTTTFKASGSYSVAVNATNINGTSNTAIFNIAVTEVTILISDVSSVNITANSTTIMWRTDKPSDSLVRYGTETGSYTLFANDPSFVTEHSIKITGLLPSRTYYYVVNSTDPSGNQNESVEYSFNTQSEAEEIVDVTPPIITFVPPTPANNSIVNESEIIINITADEYLNIAILDWNGTNETMQGSGRNWYINKILTNGTYIYMVHGKDTADNWAVSGTRTVTVVPPAPVVQAPLINDLFNTITNDNSTSITINKSQSIFFSATADQDIDTWHWYKDGIDQLNNWSSYTTSFKASGSYSVAVNATNINGTSNTAIFNIAVTDLPILISNVSTVNVTANSTTIAWRTDKPADSSVRYGTETGNYTLFANDPSFVTEHGIKITGLLPSRTYYYVVNSTDSSGTQNESVEYLFNTQPEAEEIVDVTPPTITFVAPTPANNSIVNESEIIINITADEYLNIAILDWNGTNETLQGSGRNWYINKILTNGTYIYMVHGNDTADNWAVSGTRTVTVVPPAPVVQAPLINDLFNNITNDNSTSITINKSQSIFFSATADQDIDTWHWYKDGIDQLNNWSSYTTSFKASGSYSVAVNATNANGTSNTAIFNIAVTDVTILILDVSTVNITANSTTIMWRTDEPSDSLVKYGTETGNYTLFANDPSFVSEHSIKITGLLPNTTYYYVVNSTDPSGTQNESVEYNFNTLPEAEEIVDVSPPTLTFVAPTPANNSIVNESEITINITANEYLNIAILDWNGTNETMQGSGRSWSITKILTNGTYIYMVYGNDTADNWAVSGTRTVTVVPSTRTAPLINDLFNNITNDNSTSITINKSQSIFFGATADQDIDTWHWYKDDIDQLNNWSSYTTSFNASGSYYVAVNATNANGTSNTAIFNISVTNVTFSKIHTISGAPLSGDWVISGTESYSDQVIVLTGNLNILGGASLTLNNVTLIMNATANGQRTITIQQWGNLYANISNITGNYYYYFNNYGYLNMQNSSVNKAYSIHFYDSSDDSSVIINSTIMNTASHGIYTDQASPTINHNTISDSGSYGLYVYYSSPNIINNTISGSSNYGIYVYHTSSPRIENNTIKNNNNGGIYIQYYSSPTIINNVIDKNGQYGVYVSSSLNPKIIDCTISDQTYGIRSDSQTVTVENTSISSTSYDYYLHYSAYIKSTNTSFSKSKVYFYGTGGVLDVYWYDTVTVEYDYQPVNDSFVEVFDNANSLVTCGVTDDNGQVMLAIKEYTQCPAAMLNYTPHILKATKTGYPNGSIESNVTWTKADTIVLGEEVYIPEQPIVIFGDWIINDSVSYSNKTIIVDNGNIIIEDGGSLTLNRSLLQLRYTTNAGYKIEIQDGGSIFLYDSNVTASYPELNFYYYFRNYGYLNMQNSSVSMADSIHFYDSGDDSSVINNSTIMNTANYGIYMDHASPTIIDNTISDSGSHGIYAYYSSPTIIDNTISDSGSYGLYVYYSSPNIINNTISGSSNYGIYVYHTSSPRIENNTIKNNNNGGIYIQYYSSPTIINNVIDKNGQYGVYVSSSLNPKIIDCTISDQTYGIRSDSQTVTVENTSISSTSYDYYLYYSAYIKSTNTSFSKSKVYFYGTGGVLDVYWYDTVTVEYDYQPVNDSFVEVFDNANSLVTCGVTDDNGQVMLAIKEYTQCPAAMLNYTPHILKATKTGYPNGSIESNVTWTKADTIVLGEEVYIPEQPIVIFGDWIINDSVSYSNKTIIVDNGNIIIEDGGSLTLNRSLLQLRYTTNAGYKIEIQDGGSIFLYDSNVTASYPELNFYYYFRNYGYLNMQNSSVSMADSIHFYDSGDDSSVINNSTIMNTANYGIYMDHASPTIIDNTISDSGSHGIYAYYSSPTIIDNTISDSGSYGLYVYYSSPNIINNTISGSSNYGIYVYHTSSPRIENNTIKNNNNGGIYIQYYSSPTIINNVIDKNGQYGVYVSSSLNPKIIDCTISDQTYGIRSDSQTVTVENTSISSTSYDYYLHYSAYIKSTNTSFSKSKVYFYGTGGVLDVYWYDTVTVEYDYQPVNDSFVEVFDNANSLVTCGVTDDNGQVMLAIKEYTQCPAAMLNYTPHILKATKTGYPNGSIESNVTWTKADTIVLGEEVYIPEQPIVIFGDWIINDSVSYSNKTIIVDNGNIIIEDGGSLTLNRSLLQLRYTTNAGYKIEIQDGGSIFLYDSNVTASYPELNFYYYFRNYGYLNMQNSSVSMADSIHFYDSGDDSSVINNSTIMNTANYGIYMDHASPTIIDNTISDSGSHGIYAYYSSPTIIDNTISDSGSYGLYVYYSSPNIINNTISGSSNYGIYVYHTSSPRIENNTIKNNNNGGIYIQYYSSPTIINNVIDKNGQYGVYVSSSLNPKIIDCTISDQTYGIRSDSQTVTVENTSISSTSYDYYLHYSAYIKSTNTSFSKSKVYFYGTGGVLDVYWYDTVTVEYDYQPVNDSFVEVFDNANSLVTCGVTDDNGQVMLAIKEYTQCPAAMLNYTPHILKATKTGYPNGSIESNVTWTKTDTIVLGEEVYIPEQPIVIFGDWIINDSVSYSNKTIIVDNGNIIIEDGGSLTLNRSLLQLRYTTNAGYKIEIQDGGSIFLYDSNVTASYPELNFYYYFRNYGYLNMQNSSVSTADSIHFYDSGDDSSVINNSTIMNTANYGIYMDHASPTIIDNTISDSGSHGIYAYYSSPTIIDNTISDSGSYGLYVYYSSPNIINNTISGSSNYGIYVYHTSSPRIENNTIKNNNNGGIYIQYYSSPTIINNVIDKNGQYGVYVSSSLNPKIIDCTISDQTYGIRSDSQTVTVENTSISSTDYDYYLYYSAYIKSTNTSFSKSKVYFYGTGGALDVYWHLDVNVVDANANPVSKANVSVRDYFDTVIYNGTTDLEGWTREIVSEEYKQTAAGKTYYTPHNVSAEYNDTANATIVTIDESKETTVMLSINQPLTALILSPDNNSLFIQGDTIEFMGIGFDPIDGILANSSLTWTSSIDSEIGIGSSLSLTNLSVGNHTVTFTATNSLNESVNDTVEITVIGRADLIVVDVEWSHMSPNLDDIVTFNATVKNIGRGYAIQPFYVRFYINYTYLGQTIVSHLSANESIIVIQTWTAAPDAGNITVVADYYDNIQEINESNNRRTELLPPVRLPDIVVSAITWTPTTFNESQMVNFSALIENTGAGNTTRYFEVTFYIDNTSIGSVGVNGIMAGNTTSVSRTWTATPGDHTIKVVADDLNQVPESNETNNDRIESLAMIEYADLTVSSITWTPATFCDGDIVNFTALVENVGAGNITKYFDVNFHINNTSIGSVGVNGLMAGDNVSVSKTWTAVPGNHTLKVVADDPNRVMESNETNNERSETLPGIEQPDLIVTNITWDPGSFEEGDSVIFNATIENNGTGNTSRNFYVGFKIDESYIGDVLVNGLSSGTSTSVIQTWSASVGDHNITVVADRYNSVFESNETNNTLTLPLGGVEYPDLIVSNVTWNPTTFCDGESVTFNATIKNNGTGNTSRTFYNTFYIDGSSIGSKLVNGLSAGSSVFVTLTWTATPGIHSIKVKADTNNAVSESNETNNEWNVTLPGIEYADFIVTNITWTPITFADGDTVTFNATIENNGTGNTSRNFYVSFKIDESYIGDVLVNGLSSGTSTSVTRTWSASVGDHNITVVADRYNSVFESNESNNTLTLPLGGVEYPDLIVSNITWNTTTFCDGESVTFNATIKNNGTGNTSRTFYNTFYIDESAIGGKWVNGLSAGSSINVTQTWIATPGNHTVKVIADSNNAISESNETNNERSEPLPDVEQADLIIEALTWTPSNFSDGQVVTFTVSVGNIGPGNTTRGFYARFMIDDAQIGEKYISGILSGSSIDRVQVWPATPGEHTVKVIVDSHSQVTESNESNNEYLANLSEVEMADLIVANLTWMPLNFSEGQFVAFNASIKNIGGGDTTRQFYMGFRIDNDSIGNVLVSGLSSGETKYVSIGWLAESGNHIVSAVADPEGYIVESNTSNNSLSYNLPQVLGPDLVVTDIQWSQQNVTDGNSVTFNVNIGNIGVGNTSRNCNVLLEIDDTYFQQTLFTGLVAGETTTIVIPRTWIATFGVHAINATVDNYDVIQEDNETNNGFYAILLVNDTNLPLLSSISPTNGTIIRDVFNITVTLSDGVGSGVDFNSSNITVKRDMAIVSGITEVVGDSLVFVPDSPFNESEYTVFINAADNVGSCSLITTSFIVDKTNPVINITGVAEGSLYETCVTPVIEITDLHLSSRSGIINGHQFINGTTITADGVYVLYAQADDEAGNQAEMTVNFSIDAKPSPPTGLKVYRGDTTADLSWDPNIEDDIAGYNVYRDGVRLNNDTITGISYHDTNLSANVTYQYTITAVDLAGHESEEAGVSSIRITLTGYGTLVDGSYYLTCGFADEVNVNISNEGTTQVDVDSATIELIDTVGDSTHAASEGSFTIEPSGSYFMNKQILTGNQTSKIRVVVNLSGGAQLSRVFDVNVRDSPVQPVEVSVPTLMEGYRDAIDVKLTNYGSAYVSVNPQELVLYLNDGNGTVISQGRGEGAWLWINPNTTRRIPAFINTPMAKGDIHLGNLSIDIILPTYFGLQTGQFQGSTFNVIENVPSKYQTVPPIEIYHGSLVKGGTIQFDLVYLNQGTGDLTVDQGDAMISIKDLNGSIIASGISLRSKVSVMPDSTQKFTIDVFIPVDASDTVAVEAVISASYWTLDGNADYLRFDASKFASTIKPGYNANAVTDKTVYNRGENVTISGQAKYENGTAVPNASIRLKISSKGFSRDILIDSDLNGDYTYIFKPSDTEAGMYIVSATHPAVWDIENDAEFEILGLYIEPLPGIQLAPFAPPVNLEMSQNDQRIVTLKVINLGESDLTNVHLTIIDDNAGDEVDASTAAGNFDLIPKESESVDITVTAGINAADNATFVIRATCDQGAVTTTTLSVKLYPATPRPRVAPDYIQAGISPGGVQVETVTISNVGYQALCDVTIVNPSHPWISIVTDPDLGEIDPGANATFDILINPSENVSLGVYEDNVEIVSSNHPNITFPMRFFVTSEQTGDLKFTVKNQLEEVLPGAEVSLVDQDTYTRTFTGKTDTNGETIFNGLPTGRYSYKVVAPLHEPIIGSAIVEMGTTTEVEVTALYSFLLVEWTVTPTTIEDVYEITHNITYDTKAPVPYLKMDVVVEEVYMVPGATYPGNITLTNMNDIVSVFNGTPGANIHSELVSVEFLVDTIPELKPHESVTIPFVVKLAEHHSPTAKACDMYEISIPISWDSICLFGVYKDDEWQYNVYGPVASDYLTLYIHPSCIDFIKDAALCAADILSGGAVTGVDWLTLPLRVKTCIDTGANCILQNNYCNLWQGVDCGAGLYGCLGGPFSSCLDAVNSLAKCMFQDECCGEEPKPPQPYHPPNMGGGYGGGYYGGGYSGGGLPPYSPSPWTTGPCITSPETMCIQVKLEIKQELTMERQAFDAMLKLTNLRDDYDMTDISVNIDVRDQEGNQANDLFFMDVTSMDGIGNIENGMLAPGGSGTIHWLIIPTPGAGGTEPEGVEYTAKAYINYSVKGLPFDFETWPDEITVEPMPKLTLDYMLPRNVYGDDPMTQGIIEPVVPFIWGVRINNSGYGPARNLAIDSAQPRIVESTAGVNIDFKLLGTYVDGERIENTLKINFGDIPPGKCAAAGWEMMCSLTGEFTNYTASYKHSDALGGEATSLLEAVRTHVLVHEFINDKYGQDNAFDFLIDTNEDGVPDMIIDSACNDQSITSVSAEMVGTPSPEEPTVTVVLNKGAGWVYAELDDPLDNNYNISKVVRCIDGKVLNSHNYWLRDGKIHIVDDPGENYRVTYEIGDTIPPASITNIQNISGQTWINWTWDNPADPDFDHTGVWINGEFKVDVTTPEHTYNATGLNPNTTYEIGTRTVDLSGNVNQTWMNDTAKTLLVHDITPPNITNVTAIDITTNSATITWDTDELSDSVVKYGTESGAYTLQEHNASNVMSHSIKLTELVADTIYYFVVNSTDLAGNSNESTEYNLITVTRLCGDVAPYPDCNGIVDMGDVILLLNNVSYPEDPRYILCNNWAGDCRCTGVRDMGDVILLLNNVSYPEDPRYMLDCC